MEKRAKELNDSQLSNVTGGVEEAPEIAVIDTDRTMYRIACVSCHVPCDCADGMEDARKVLKRWQGIVKCSCCGHMVYEITEY